MLIPTLTQLKRQVRWSDQRLCRVVGVPYGSFRRWKARLAQGAPARGRPGPKKVVPLSLEELRGAVDGLDHGGQRSRGAGAVYRQYQTQISRRELAALIATVRRALAQQRQAALLPHHVARCPAWSGHWMTRSWRATAHQILRLHQVQDLASRYKFLPWVGERILGETVAERLEQLFLQHGAAARAQARQRGQSQPARGRRGLGPLPGRAAELAAAVPALQRRDGTRGPGTESAPAGEDPRQRPAPGAQVQHWAELLAHDLNHRPRRCAPGPSRLPGVSGCPAGPPGVYSAQAKGGLR